MELMIRKWKCRYVEEYLAVGEAPAQLRNCFQQRSRWAKVRGASLFTYQPVHKRCEGQHCKDSSIWLESGSVAIPRAGCSGSPCTRSRAALPDQRMFF